MAIIHYLLSYCLCLSKIMAAISLSFTVSNVLGAGCRLLPASVSPLDTFRASEIMTISSSHLVSHPLMAPLFWNRIE